MHPSEPPFLRIQFYLTAPYPCSYPEEREAELAPRIAAAMASLEPAPGEPPRRPGAPAVAWIAGLGGTGLIAALAARRFARRRSRSAE